MWNNSLSNIGTKKKECILIAKYISYAKFRFYSLNLHTNLLCLLCPIKDVNLAGTLYVHFWQRKLTKLP